MMDEISSQLMRKLHYQGRLTNEQLRDIVARYQDADSESFLRALIDEEIIDHEWADQARRTLHRRGRRQRDTEEAFQVERSFGQVALRRDWITLDQLEEAILEQQRTRRLKLYFRIGEILMHLEHLTLEQVRSVLAEQGNAVQGCDRCSSIVRMVAGAKDADPSCPFCSGELVDSLFLDLVRSDEPSSG